MVSSGFTEKVFNQWMTISPAWKVHGKMQLSMKIQDTSVSATHREKRLPAMTSSVETGDYNHSNNKIMFFLERERDRK